MVTSAMNTTYASPYCGQACVKIPKRSGFQDLKDPGPGVMQDFANYIFNYSFCQEILEILDSALARFPGDPGQFGSWHESGIRGVKITAEFCGT